MSFQMPCRVAGTELPCELAMSRYLPKWKSKAARPGSAPTTPTGLRPAEASRSAVESSERSGPRSSETRSYERAMVGDVPFQSHRARMTPAASDRSATSMSSSMPPAGVRAIPWKLVATVMTSRAEANAVAPDSAVLPRLIDAVVGETQTDRGGDGLRGIVAVLDRLRELEMVGDDVAGQVEHENRPTRCRTALQHVQRRLEADHAVERPLRCDLDDETVVRPADVALDAHPHPVDGEGGEVDRSLQIQGAAVVTHRRSARRGTPRGLELEIQVTERQIRLGVSVLQALKEGLGV